MLFTDGIDDMKKTGRLDLVVEMFDFVTPRSLQNFFDTDPVDNRITGQLSFIDFYSNVCKQ